MRVLHLSDTHLGSAGRERAAADAFLRAMGPALRGEVDAVVHTGDVFDRSQPPPDAIRLAFDTFEQVGARIPMVVLAGNHDRHGVRRSIPAILRGVAIVDEPTAVDLGGVRIGCIPWIPEPARWAAEADSLDCEIVAAHQAFDGMRVPNFQFRVGRPADTIGGEHLPKSLRYVMCGHIHPRQVVRIGRVTVVCPGSTVRTTEEGPAPKGVAIWRFRSDVEFELQPLGGVPGQLPLFPAAVA